MNKIKSFVKQVKSYGGGWGNGYAIIPKDHPILEGVGGSSDSIYDSEVFYSLSFDGELTFSSTVRSCKDWVSVADFPEDCDDDDIVIGFDTQHCHNTPEHDQTYVVGITAQLVSIIERWEKE